jgi:SNF2 family DNA or RNA helicase
MIPPPWPQQQKGFEFARGLWRNGRRGAMLAMVMGTGKTRVAIDLAEDIDAHLVLIICPLRVVPVWEAQFLKYTKRYYYFAALDDRYPSVKRKMLEARDRLRWALEEPGRRVAIAINYDSARREPFASWSLNQAWPLTILDESHKIKQNFGRTSKWAAQLGLRSFHRLALTGTPMAHEPTDIWGQFRFLDPHLLDPTFSSFRDRYAVKGGYFDKQVVGWRNLDELERIFRQIAFRVDDSVLELPPEMDETQSTEMGDKGAEMYDAMEREMIAWIEADRNVTAANAMVKLLRLAQLTGGSATDEAGGVTPIDSAKEALLTDLLDDLDEPVVVFARFRADLDRVHCAARAAGCLSRELSGRRDELAEWQSAKQSGVLAVQMQAGGVGIDLSRARVAIYYSIGFSLAEYLQSRARIRRPPQTRPCLFYHLQIKESVDEYILRAVHRRGDLVDSVLGELKRKGASRAHILSPARAR